MMRRRRKLSWGIKNLRCPSGEVELAVELDMKLMSPLHLTSFLIGDLYFQLLTEHLHLEDLQAAHAGHVQIQFVIFLWSLVLFL